MPEDKTRLSFQDVDTTDDPEYFVNALDHITELDSVQSYKRHANELLRLVPGSRVLDVGCGTGEDAITLADIVGPSGHAIGVDRSDTMIAEAMKPAREAGSSVGFAVGDVYDLDFEDGYFDGARADRIFHHLEAPSDALRELLRVLKPGGHMVTFEADLDTIAIDSSDRAMTRKVVHYFADYGRTQGWIGRQLRRMYKELGFENVTVIPVGFVFSDLALITEMFELQQNLDALKKRGDITPEDAQRWLDDLKDRDERGLFYTSIFTLMVFGTKPYGIRKTSTRT